MRINRFLASAGLGSRRACEELVLNGQVLVNNAVVTDLATQVDPSADVVRVGRKVLKPQAHVYFLLNKPKGYVCTRSDDLGRKTIFDLVPDNAGRLFHVGRLDLDSEGLIILTNDGDFAEALAHPSHSIEKEYEVVLDKPFRSELTAKLLRGITLETGRARMESVHVVAPAKLSVILKQGLKRQIREMLWRIGRYDVKKLTRVRIGPLADPRLKTGYWRPLDNDEIQTLRASAKGATREQTARKKLRTPRSRD